MVYFHILTGPWLRRMEAKTFSIINKCWNPMMGCCFSSLADSQILLRFTMQNIRWLKSSPIGKHALWSTVTKELFNSNPFSLHSTLYINISFTCLISICIVKILVVCFSFHTSLPGVHWFSVDFLIFCRHFRFRQCFLKPH